MNCLAGKFTHPGIAALGDPRFATRKEGEKNSFIAVGFSQRIKGNIPAALAKITLF